MDSFINQAINNPSFFDEMLEFHIENHYPKIAQGLRGEWPKGLQLVLSRLPSEADLLWMVAAPNPGVSFSKLATEKDWMDFLSDSDGSNVAYNYLYQTCHQLIAEILDDSFANSLKVMARGAWQGLMWWAEDEERRLKKQLWSDLLGFLSNENKNISHSRSEVSVSKITSFVKPELFKVFERR